MLKINQIYCGDCVEVMRQIDSGVIDLTVTSPPYDNLRDYKGSEFRFARIAEELFRITKDGGVVVWIVSDQTIEGSETGTSFRQALYFKQLGFLLHDTMIWMKESNPYPGVVRYYQAFEYMFVFSKKTLNTFNGIKDKKNKYAGLPRHSGKIRGHDGSVCIKNKNRIVKHYGMRTNVWDIHNIAIPGTEHPAVFPERLAADHIKSWSNKGDLVLDPMCGSGTVCKAARMLCRKFIGIDISQDHCDLAREKVFMKIIRQRRKKEDSRRKKEGFGIGE